jgi:hypothetical protein
MKPFSQQARGMWADAAANRKTGKPVLQLANSGNFTPGPRTRRIKGIVKGFQSAVASLPIPPRFSPSRNGR